MEIMEEDEGELEETEERKPLSGDAECADTTNARGKMDRNKSEVALSRFPREKSKGRVQWYWKAACVCRPWKLKGRI
jgi:hypothetical protein